MPEQENKTEGQFNSDLFRSGATSIDSMEPQGKKDVTEPEQKPQPEVKPEPEPKVEPQGGTVSYWDLMKKDLGGEYKVPDVITKRKKDDGTDLTPEEEFEIFRNEIYKFTDFGDDEFVEEYRTAKKEKDFDRAKWLEQKVKMSSVNDDDFLEVAYKANFGKTDKRPDGLTDEQIKEEIGKLTAVQKKKEVNEYKSAMQNFINAENEKRAKLENEKFEAKLKEAQSANEKLAKGYLDKVKGKNNIEGIEFSDADLQDFHKEVPNLLKIEVRQGKNGEKYAITKAQEILEKVMSTEEGSLSLLPYLYLVDKGKMKGYTSAIKEGVKKEIIENKLDIKPEDTPGTSSGGPYTFDSGLFRSGTGAEK